MAKSQSEWLLREAEGDEAIAWIRRGEEKNAWPGQKNNCTSSLPEA